MMEAMLPNRTRQRQRSDFTARVTQAFLNMKKLFDALMRAYEGK
jgi:hypothetical protein